ncbi:MAG: serine/threonine-protein kinase [Cyanobacteria bacterium J06639_16]
MANFPDFKEYGYLIEEELGCNRAGGRVTYLARDALNHQPFVLKQFQFAKTQASWADFDAYQREIEVLRSLNHPGIPRYVDGFQTDEGFCMVQDYKPAVSLSANRSFSPPQIQSIAIAVLEILVYLQSRIPPVIHRDIKPDNILVDDDLNVYLVDFGFARVGDGEVGVSSVVKGTLGFMPPEQLFNRTLTEASDLYGLGMTLVCLLTGTKPDDIGDLVDISYRVKFKHLVPKINIHWVKWLERLVETRSKERYPNAVAALQSMPNCPLYSPKVRLSQSSIDLTASRSNQTLVQTLQVSNPVPDTELQGQWEILSHPSDPPTQEGSHPWITIEPNVFRGNEATFEITVDASRLMTDHLYERTLRLTTNALPEAYSLSIKLKTAPLLTRQKQAYWRSLGLLFFAMMFLYRSVYWLVGEHVVLDGNLALAAFGTAAGTAGGLEVAAWALASTGSMSANVGAIAGAIVGTLTLLSAWFMAGNINSGSVAEILLGCGIGLVSGWISGISLGLAVDALLKERFRPNFSIRIVLLTAFLGCAVSLGLTIGFFQPVVALSMLILGIGLVSHLIQVPLYRAKAISKQRQSQRYLIRP